VRTTGLVSKSIPSLFGGISKQPPLFRLDNQVADLVNMLPTIDRGLVRRPPLEFLRSLTGSNITEDSMAQVVVDSAGEEYILIITGNATTPVEMYKLSTGAAMTITFGSYSGSSGAWVANAAYKDYFVSTAPGSFRTVNLGLQTLLVNPAKVTAMKSFTLAARTVTLRSLVWVKKGLPSITYTITLGSNTYALTTTTTPADYSTAEIVADLVALINVDTGSTGITATASAGSYIKLTKTVTNSTLKGNQLYIGGSAHDTAADTAISFLANKVSTFSDLPPDGTGTNVINVYGDVDKGSVSYYVQYQSDGYWKEVCLPDEDPLDFDPATMPHVLLKIDATNWYIARVSGVSSSGGAVGRGIGDPAASYSTTTGYALRAIGDLTTVGAPTFIGSCIRDACLYRDRLCFISDSGVTFSRAGNYFHFWPQTMLDVLDDDPIDVAIPVVPGKGLMYVLPFNKTLLAIADARQYILTSGENLFTPNTATIDIATEYKASTTCKPVLIGADAYVPSGSTNGFDSLRKYYIKEQAISLDSETVTNHVEGLLPQLTKLLAMDSVNILIGWSVDDPKSMYLYKYLYDGDQQFQGAWTKWTFSETIVALWENGGSEIRCLMRSDTSQLHYLTMDLTHSYNVTSTVDMALFADKRGTATAVYAGGTTTWTLPWTDEDTDLFIIDTTTGLMVEGLTKTSSSTYTKPGDHTSSGTYIAGKLFTSSVTLSPWLLRLSPDKPPDIQGRLQIRNITLGVLISGDLTATISTPGRDDFDVPFSGLFLNDSTIGSIPLYTGAWKFPVLANATDATIEIASNGFYPLSIQEVAYEGYYVTRARAL
jgi:hypothetical protein